VADFSDKVIAMSEQQSPTPLIVYGTAWCGDCFRSRHWLEANHIPFESIDIDDHEGAASYVMAVNNGSRTVPTIVFPDGSILAEPSNMQLAVHIYHVLGILTADAQRALALS
jgi:mycoredoxin